jgi:electron transport complex protein RnfC
VQDTGMVGLGGAAFPTHVKLRVPKDQHIDTLVVNGCECEPYLTTDHRVMVEYTAELLAGVRIAMRVTGATSAAIGVEDNKQDAIEAIRARLPADGSVRVQGVKTKYPQGSEKMLIKVLLGREVPSGGFPYQVGAVVNNVGTLAQLGMLLPRSQGLIERVVTFAGPGIKRPGNYIVPLGTPVGFALDCVGYEGNGSGDRVIFGGPMMGNSVGSLDVPITKGVSGVVVLADAPATLQPIWPCIRCGRCLDVCPVKLNPSQMGRLAAKRQYEAMQAQYHLNDCLECGSCAYVCPSNIPLVQYFRIAKGINRENRERAA